MEMKSKTYYKQLCRNYFDATLTAAQERQLQLFLAQTYEPEFDEIKAVMGYFACGKALRRRANFSTRPAGRWLMVAAAAVAAAVVVTGLSIRKTPDKQLSMMEKTLNEIFSSRTDVAEDLSGLLTMEP